MEESRDGDWTLVARKPYFGLPTACPVCLPVYIYLKFARCPFNLEINSAYPDSDQIPYVEGGTYVAYNNEKGGVIQQLKQDGVVDLDSEFSSLPEWVSMKAMMSSWLADAITYELWLGSGENSAKQIYYSDLPWVIGKVLFVKQVYDVKQRFNISKQNAEKKEEERMAVIVSTIASANTMSKNKLFHPCRPTSLDADLVGHVLFTLKALPEDSVIRAALLEHGNLVRYAERHKNDFLTSGQSSASASNFQPPPSAAQASSKPKRKPKREKTEEEKSFQRKAKYFIGAQLVAVLLFLSLLGSSSKADLDEDDED
ncbi:unnamed protein product [Linum tenue]|uniref:Thioredoxin-like fold domain-containing protein n=1 Tax=Linum tenue TaxID=586396 RepID=A0AAV0L1J1_9ROSI|nr:unnamed protein product [Linum tenue]